MQKDSKNTEEGNKKLILINETINFKKILKGKNLLDRFLNYWYDKSDQLDFITNDAILAWITDDYNEVKKNANLLYKVFDLFIKIPLLKKIEREAIFRDYLEKHPKISFDVNKIISYTENWEVLNIKQLLKVSIFKHFLNSDLNNKSNELTDLIIELIETGEFLPSFMVKNSEKGLTQENIEGLMREQRFTENNPAIQVNFQEMNELISQIRDGDYSEFMLNQLYENAASKNYSELLLVIDKLNKNEPIEENDRMLLVKYPFILSDKPRRAQINLEKAKKRIDLIKMAFGKENLIK